ncbi:hypothetical protein GGR44_003168 [Sphingobium fontiphilum]|uniref:Uncharacterized protein n=1 Tax=Sphingobium fontiphilum TaxID=944425 RepID=A0A7W6GQD2_9SPHN|nr:hypothetical protein [Sphingobium fontiphilum]MBB3983477.1 hypothetical protein [Sphingobium fontiphilum]
MQEDHRGETEQGASEGGIIFALLAIALLLAIAFLFLTDRRRADHVSETAVDAAIAVGNGAQAVGDAARNRAEEWRKPQ